MSEKIVRFSRLLRIFELNDAPAFIIELEENNQKKLYISYDSAISLFDRFFEEYKKTKLKGEFKELSEHCLLDQCNDASGMFEGSPITHFEADCSSIVRSKSMFYKSDLRFINIKFPLVESANYMFSNSKIKEIIIDFPKLKNGVSMFYKSPLEKITSQFPLLENGSWMFASTHLKKITSQFPNLKNKKRMFEKTPPELKQNFPQYFI